MTNVSKYAVQSTLDYTDSMESAATTCTISFPVTGDQDYKVKNS